MHKKERTDSGFQEPSRPERLLRLKEVLQIIPVSRSSWYEGMKRGLYPPGFLLSKRTRVWKESDIRALMEG